MVALRHWRLLLRKQVLPRFFKPITPMGTVWSCLLVSASDKLYMTASCTWLYVEARARGEFGTPELGSVVESPSPSPPLPPPRSTHDPTRRIDRRRLESFPSRLRLLPTADVVDGGGGNCAIVGVAVVLFVVVPAAITRLPVEFFFLEVMADESFFSESTKFPTPPTPPPFWSARPWTLSLPPPVVSSIGILEQLSPIVVGSSSRPSSVVPCWCCRRCSRRSRRRWGSNSLWLSLSLSALLSSLSASLS